MSGVIDTDGTQYERCNGCGDFVNMDKLIYEHPTLLSKYGRDLCRKCGEHRIDDAKNRNETITYWIYHLRITLIARKLSDDRLLSKSGKFNADFMFEAGHCIDGMQS